MLNGCSAAPTDNCQSESCKRKLKECETETRMLSDECRRGQESVMRLEMEVKSLSKCKDTEMRMEKLMMALSMMEEKNSSLQESLSAETRFKLDLFSALGETRRQLDAVSCKYSSSNQSQQKTLLSCKCFMFSFTLEIYSKDQLEAKERELNSFRVLFKQSISMSATSPSPQQQQQQALSPPTSTPPTSLSSTVAASSASPPSVASSSSSSSSSVSSSSSSSSTVANGNASAASVTSGVAQQQQQQQQTIGLGLQESYQLNQNELLAQYLSNQFNALHAAAAAVAASQSNMNSNHHHHNNNNNNNSHMNGIANNNNNATASANVSNGMTMQNGRHTPSSTASTSSSASSSTSSSSSSSSSSDKSVDAYVGASGSVNQFLPI